MQSSSVRDTRRPFRLAVCALALGIPLVALAPSVGAAGAPSGKNAASTGDAKKTYDSENVTAISKFTETCIVGNGLFVAKDYVGAVEKYRAAKVLSPKNPLASYLLAEALLAQGDIGAADGALKSAARAAEG